MLQAAALLLSVLGDSAPKNLRPEDTWRGELPPTEMDPPNLPSDPGQNFAGAKVVNFDFVQDGMVVFLYNTLFPYSRLGHWDGGCGFYNGPVDESQLWTVVKTVWGNESYFLTSHKYPKDRYSFNPSYGSYCYGKGMYQDQAWEFQPKEVNSTYFTIRNNQHQTCVLANWKDGEGGAYCLKPNEQVGSPNYFFVKSPFGYTENANGNGPTFTVAGDFENDSDDPVSYTFDTVQGFSESISHSVAKTTTFTVTISFTVQAMFFGTGFSNTDTFSIMHSTTESYERACTQSYQLDEKIMYNVPPNKHMCLYQAGAGLMDLVSGTSFNFQSSVYKLKECSDGHKKGTVLKASELPDEWHDAHDYHPTHFLSRSRSDGLLETNEQAKFEKTVSRLVKSE